jgi:hypothetical protein
MSPEVVPVGLFHEAVELALPLELALRTVGPAIQPVPQVVPAKVSTSVSGNTALPFVPVSRTHRPMHCPAGSDEMTVSGDPTVGAVNVCDAGAVVTEAIVFACADDDPIAVAPVVSTDTANASPDGCVNPTVTVFQAFDDPFELCRKMHTYFAVNAAFSAAVKSGNRLLSVLSGTCVVEMYLPDDDAIAPAVEFPADPEVTEYFTRMSAETNAAIDHLAEYA